MERFLVIQLARFGDVLQSGRLIRSLMKQGETHLCVDRSLIGLAELVYAGAQVHGLHAHAGLQADAVALEGAALCGDDVPVLAELATTAFSAVYNLNHSGMNRALARMFSPEIMHGYAMRGDQVVRSRWFDLAYRWTRSRRSAPLNLVDVWAGLLPDPIAPEACNPVAVPGGRGLGVVLAGREARRSLPPEVLGPCVHALFEALDGPDVWLFGSEYERPLARKLLRHLPGRVLDRVRDLSGRTSLTDLRDALIGLDAVLTPDTGVMHLAAQVGAPVQGVFLSSAWVWETGPYGLGHTVWQAHLPCAPCLEAAACAEVACLAPFRQPALLRALSGVLKTGEAHAATAAQGIRDTAVSGLWHLTSGMDKLGLIWNTTLSQSLAHHERVSPRHADLAHGEERGAPASFADADAHERRALRALLAEYRRTGDPCFVTRLGAQADTFYQEADWMLPDALP